MKLGICGFDKEPRDAAVNQANGDKPPPVGLSGMAITVHQSESPGGEKFSIRSTSRRHGQCGDGVFVEDRINLDV